MSCLVISFLDYQLIYEDSFRLYVDISVEEAFNRIFEKDDIYTLSRLKDLVQLFSIKWSFIAVRLNIKFVCNRVDMYGSKFL